jgi:hypothetical protein
LAPREPEELARNVLVARLAERREDLGELLAADAELVVVGSEKFEPEALDAADHPVTAVAIRLRDEDVVVRDVVVAPSHLANPASDVDTAFRDIVAEEFKPVVHADPLHLDLGVAWRHAKVEPLNLLALESAPGRDTPSVPVTGLVRPQEPQFARLAPHVHPVVGGNREIVLGVGKAQQFAHVRVGDDLVGDVVLYLPYRSRSRPRCHVEGWGTLPSRVR